MNVRVVYILTGSIEYRDEISPLSGAKEELSAYYFISVCQVEMTVACYGGILSKHTCVPEHN